MMGNWQWRSLILERRSPYGFRAMRRYMLTNTNSNRFLLITASEPLAQSFAAKIRQIVAHLGELTMSVQSAHHFGAGYKIIFVDATTVCNLAEILARIHADAPESRIVVMSASPTWREARTAFEAGAAD